VRAAVLVAALLALAPSAARADAGAIPRVPREEPRRGGVHGGVALQLGSYTTGPGPVDCGGCVYAAGSFGASVYGGWDWRPRIRFGGEVSGDLEAIEAGGQRVLVQLHTRATAHYRLGERWWLGGGVGPSFLWILGDPGQRLGGVGFDGSARWEPTRWGPLVPQVRADLLVVAHASPWQPSTQVLLGLGIAWSSGP
jgi:hypothetical protein